MAGYLKPLQHLLILFNPNCNVLNIKSPGKELTILGVEKVTNIEESRAHLQDRLRLSEAGIKISGHELYNVINTTTGEVLGQYQWRTVWKRARYVWVPEDGTIYTDGCNLEIANFGRKLNGLDSV